MLGHASVATTLSLYAHATDASHEALVDAIDARYGPRLRVVVRSRIRRRIGRGGQSSGESAHTAGESVVPRKGLEPCPACWSQT